MAQTIIVDTTPGYRMPTIYYSQGDIGRTFSIDLQSRFGESLPASPTITIQATKPSGLGFSAASTSISGAVVTFTVTETMSNEAGRFPAELKIVKSGTTLFTANFYIECEASAHPEGTTDGDLDSISPKFMSVTTTTLPAGSSATYSYDATTNTATFGIPKGADGSLASDILAPTYSSSSTYAVGDYVYYNGDLYICNTEISTAEAWTSGHWTQVTVSGELSDLKDDIDSLTTKADGSYQTIALSTFDNEMSNTSGFALGVNGGYGSNSGTTSYLFDITEQTSFYFGDTTAPYLSVVIIESPTTREWVQSGSDYLMAGLSATRKRKSDNNLPSEGTPYTTSNAMLIITITASHDVDVYIKGQITLLSNDIYLNTRQLSQLEKKPCIQYVSVDTDALPNSYYKQEVDIYIPTTVGFIKYLFVRNELDAYNANNWRLDKAFAYSESKEKRFLVVNSGEYEMALQINGRSDFIGGIAHGDEVYDSITFLVDGNEVSDITSLTNITEFDELKIIETSDLYDPDDGATLSTKAQFSPIAKHGKEYTFNKDGLRLRQFVKWLHAETLTASYMTMFPIVRGNDSVSATQITDTFYANDDYINYDVSTIVDASGNAWAWRKYIDHAVIWSDVSGVSAEVIMLKQPQIENVGARQFKVQDSSYYNKMYWSVCGVGGELYDASVDERFVTESLYRVNICK